jgi:hypothetical protein
VYAWIANPKMAEGTGVAGRDDRVLICLSFPIFGRGFMTRDGETARILRHSQKEGSCHDREGSIIWWQAAEAHHQRQETGDRPPGLRKSAGKRANDGIAGHPTFTNDESQSYSILCTCMLFTVNLAIICVRQSRDSRVL